MFTVFSWEKKLKYKKFPRGESSLQRLLICENIALSLEIIILLIYMVGYYCIYGVSVKVKKKKKKRLG